MNLLRRLAEPVPFNLHTTSRLPVDPQRLRDYISDPATMDDYCHALTHTQVTADRYQTTMRFLGVPWKADMQYHRTDDGLHLQGAWQGPVLPAFGESFTLQVRPCGSGAELTRHEQYLFPRYLVPTFPLLRWTLKHTCRGADRKLQANLS